MSDVSRSPNIEQVPDSSWSWHIDKEDVDFDKRKVFDQETFICCSAVAGTEVCELVYHIEQQKRPPALSKQLLINRVPEEYPLECGPSEDDSLMQPFKVQTALKYIKDFGVCTDRELRFKRIKSLEKGRKHVKRMRIEDFEADELDVERDEDYLLSLIYKSPIAGEMKFYETFLEHGDGLFRDPHAEPECLHAVVIIGHGVEDGIPYYWIKNSHGPKWGIRGIGKVARSLFVRYCVPVEPYMEDNRGRRKRKRT